MEVCISAKISTKQFLMGIYNALPGVRGLMASARGYQLRRFRYGPETERLVEAALERERWPFDRLRQWQREQLTRALDHAARNVPFYREQWAGRRRKGDSSSWECLENWPVLEKETIRLQPRAFLADGADPRCLTAETTSGTTGHPIPIWYGRDTALNWFSLVEARWRRWYGVSRHDRWALLGSQLVAPVSQTVPPFWVWNRGLTQLYMSVYHVSPKSAGHYLDAMKRYRVRYLWGHSSAVHQLARTALHEGRSGIGLTMVLTSAEPLRPHQRRDIGRAFGCPVFESYGMSEMAVGAAECIEGSLHLWPEAGWLEVLDGATPVRSGTRGDIVSTCFLNPSMPLVRYRVGDLGVARPVETTCACGRSLPILGSLDGRIGDVLYTKEGRQISPGAVEAIFDRELPFLEAQIVQENLRQVCIRFVPAGPLTLRMEQDLRDQVRQRLGDMEVTLQPVREIPRGNAGKFRAVVCRIPPEGIPVGAQQG